MIPHTEQEIAFVPRQLIRDERISWKAKGIYSFLCTLLEGTEFDKKVLLDYATDKKTSVNNGFKELKDAGYVIQVRTDNGFEYKLTVPNKSFKRE